MVEKIGEFRSTNGVEGSVIICKFLISRPNIVQTVQRGTYKHANELFAFSREIIKTIIVMLLT